MLTSNPCFMLSISISISGLEIPQSWSSSRSGCPKHFNLDSVILSEPSQKQGHRLNCKFPSPIYAGYILRSLDRRSSTDSLRSRQSISAINQTLCRTRLLNSHVSLAHTPLHRGKSCRSSWRIIRQRFAALGLSSRKSLSWFQTRRASLAISLLTGSI
jgi:hypothetical protein